MPYILLTRNKKTWVDTEDFNRLGLFVWFAQIRSDKRAFHAARCVTRSGRQITLHMHREILGLQYGDGKIVDHINGDGLDNRRCNLRICSSSDNNCNCGSYRGGTSLYKGVSWHKQNRKWQATIQKDGKSHYLGLFISESEAAEVYNIAAVRLHGQFAYLNQIK